MRRGQEYGYTLVELLAASVILAIISFALTESIISSLRNTEDSTNRTVQSVERQRLASVFVPDVQSSIREPLRDDPPCGDDPAVVTFTWEERGETRAASYVDTVDDGERSLVRRYCEEDASGQLPVRATRELIELPSADQVLKPVVPGPCDEPPTPRFCLEVKAPDGSTAYVVSASRRTAE